MTNVLLIIGGVLFGLVSLLMIVAILLQESKGGGLAALGGTRAESAFGASNPLRKMTVVLSIMFFVLAGTLSIFLRPPQSVLTPERPQASAPEKPEGGGVEAEVPVPEEESPKAPAKDAPKGALKDAPKPAVEKPAPAPVPDKKPEAGK